MQCAGIKGGVMAFDYLNDYTDKIIAMIETEQQAGRSDILLCQVLTQYYESVLSKPKFISQRHWLVKSMHRVCPAFAEGYFGKKREFSYLFIPCKRKEVESSAIQE